MPSYLASFKRGYQVYPEWMQAKVLPIKFQGQKSHGRPVDCENLENYIPRKFVCIQYVLISCHIFSKETTCATNSPILNLNQQCYSYLE